MILVMQSGDKAVNMDYIREVFVYTEGREKKRHGLIARHNYNGWDGQFVLGEYSARERAENVFDWLVRAWTNRNQENDFEVMPMDEEATEE